MNGKTLWLGLAGLWVLAALVVAALFVMPEDTSAPTKVGDVEDAPEAPPDSGDPLKQTAQLEALQPEWPEETTPEAAKTPTEIEPEDKSQPDKKPETKTNDGRPDVVIGPSDTATPRSYGDVRVVQGGTLTLPAGDVNIGGDVRIDGTLNAADSTLVFDGADQTIEGKAVAGKIILRGGTKRLKGQFGTTNTGNADPGKAGLYVEAGTTLIIETGGKWTTPNPYGFQIAGNLVIDGGEFHCRFSNGNGTDRGEESWLSGSTLTIHSGKFVGNGDADFSGATITIHDGALEINDDIWSTGDALTIHGGSMRNTTGGGMFAMTGTVQVHGGKLQVYQNSYRSLRVGKETSVYCTGGEISINGRAATGNDGGILLYSSATLPNLVINASTRIHKDTPGTAYLSVNGDMQIAKGQKFEAHGYQVISNFVQTPDSGEFVP